MLKGIPSILSPELMKVLMEMGHGDEIVLGDGNFSSATHARRIVRCDGHNVRELLDAILQFFPLDTYVEKSVIVQEVVPGDQNVQAIPPIWSEFAAIVEKHAPENKGFETMERYAFYERAKKAFAIVATTDRALYANIILKKGIV
jgi:L-fucose mutarotase